MKRAGTRAFELMAVFQCRVDRFRQWGTPHIEGLAAFQFWQGSTPEMIGKATEAMVEGKKHDFDFPTVRIDGDDLSWAQLQVGAHQDVRMFSVDDPNKTDQIFNWLPQEIGMIKRYFPRFSIDRYLCILEEFRKTKE